VFASALDSVTGARSALGYKPKSKILVVLVDGMGAENVLARAGHAPWLAREIAGGATGLSSFPATTSTNIAGFATGMNPGEHGFIGHVVSDSRFGVRLNLLNGWTDETDPTLWQPHVTVSERAAAQGVACNVIAAEEYRSTGFTKATMRQANFVGVDDLRERFDQALELLGGTEDSINYLYVPELDKFGHLNGWQSPGWAIQLEIVASEIDRLIKRLPKDAGVVITADHGMIDSLEDDKVELAELLDPFGVEFFGGDTRTALLYLQEAGGTKEIQKAIGDSRFFNCYTPSELEAWYGEFGQQAKDRLPSLILIAKGEHTLYHSRFSKQKSYRMIAHHGAFTNAELRIPLIRVGI
jgi:predicted AlkP superfamily pyrophosphatase or phosphodiesterase